MEKCTKSNLGGASDIDSILKQAFLSWFGHLSIHTTTPICLEPMIRKRSLPEEEQPFFSSSHVGKHRRRHYCPVPGRPPTYTALQRGHPIGSPRGAATEAKV